MKYTSTLQTLSHVVKTEGFTSLWKGFTPYFARSGTQTVRILFGGGGVRCTFFSLGVLDLEELFLFVGGWVQKALARRIVDLVVSMGE